MSVRDSLTLTLQVVDTMPWSEQVFSARNSGHAGILLFILSIDKISVRSSAPRLSASDVGLCHRNSMEYALIPSLAMRHAAAIALLISRNSFGSEGPQGGSGHKVPLKS